MTKALEIHFLDMVRYREQGERDIEHDALDRWLTWLDERSPPELVEEVVRMDSAIQKASERQEHVLSDEEAIRIYEMREKAEWDYLSSQKRAQRLGREEGREEEKLEIARKMKYAGKQFSEISEFTGLSQEQIQNL